MKCICVSLCVACEYIVISSSRQPLGGAGGAHAPVGRQMHIWLSYQKGCFRDWDCGPIGKALGSIPRPHQLGMVAHVCILSIRKVEAGVSRSSRSSSTTLSSRPEKSRFKKPQIVQMGERQACHERRSSLAFLEPCYRLQR